MTCSACAEYQRGEREDATWAGMRVHACAFIPEAAGPVGTDRPCRCGCEPRPWTEDDMTSEEDARRATHSAGGDRELRERAREQRVADWHAGEGGRSLHESLGMTWDEYREWVER